MTLTAVGGDTRRRNAGTGEPCRTYRSYVDGKDVDGDAWVHVIAARALLDDTFTSLSIKRNLDRGLGDPEAVPPGVIAGRVARAHTRSIEAALRAAAHAAPLWGAVPLEIRLDAFMRGVHARLVEQADTIVEVLVAEGHPVQLARWEVSGMLEGMGPQSWEFNRAQMEVAYTDALGRRLLVRRRPDGVVCVNPPSNAPLASALLSSLALAAGNAVVIRAPRSCPLGVSYAMRDIVVPVLDELGAPPGTLNVLCGDPGPMLTTWLESPSVNDIMYFGSSENGLRFQNRCVAAGKKPILELAGNDLVVVWKDADLDYAAEALTEAFYGSGQLCMIPNQALVHPDVADELIARLVAKVAAIRPGYPDSDGVLLTPVLRNDKFFAYLRDAVDKSATVMCGGHGMDTDGTRSPVGMFLEPTVLRVDGLATARDVDAVRNETFFPLLPVIVPRPDDDQTLLDAFVAFMNSNEYGLRNSVWARDELVIDRFLAAVDNGGLLKINDSHIGFVARLPTHGGTGLTGGVFGEANYPMLRTSHMQGVAVSATGVRPRDAVFGAWRALRGGAA